MCRTPCKYPGKHIAFHVNEGSTDYWLSLLVEFEDGDGDIGAMQIKEVSIKTHPLGLSQAYSIALITII